LCALARRSRQHQHGSRKAKTGDEAAANALPAIYNPHHASSPAMQAQKLGATQRPAFRLLFAIVPNIKLAIAM
jgi:hypothetical protein